jgi:hypothetical protein
VFGQHAPLAKYAFTLYDGKLALLETVLLRKVIYRR